VRTCSRLERHEVLFAVYLRARVCVIRTRALTRTCVRSRVKRGCVGVQSPAPQGRSNVARGDRGLCLSLIEVCYAEILVHTRTRSQERGACTRERDNARGRGGIKAGIGQAV
jgi:hypothetical protein